VGGPASPPVVLQTPVGTDHLWHPGHQEDLQGARHDPRRRVRQAFSYREGQLQGLL